MPDPRRPLSGFTLLNPAILFPVVWLAVIAASPFTDLGFDPYSGRFYRYLTLGVLLFSASAWFASALVPHLFPMRMFRAMRATFAARIANRRLSRLYSISMLTALAVQAYDRYLLVGPGWWTPESVVVFRYLVYEMHYDTTFPLIRLLNFFFFTAVPILFLHWRDIPRWERLGQIVLLTGFAYLSSARASVFTIALIAYFFVWQVRGFRFGQSVAIAALLAGSYSAIGIMAGKDADVNEYFSVANYAVGPSHVLDRLLAGERNDEAGDVYSFPFLHGTLAKLGVIAEQRSNLPFYYTPQPTNVYTIFGTYVLDFGVVGSLFSISLIGFACGTIFGAARLVPNEPYLQFLLALALTLTSLSIFHDFFTSAGYVWISAVAAFVIMPRTSRYAIAQRQHKAPIAVPARG